MSSAKRIAFYNSHILLFYYTHTNTAQYQPGLYAIEMIGELPDDVIEHCENLGLPYKASRAAQKLK